MFRTPNADGTLSTTALTGAEYKAIVRRLLTRVGVDPRQATLHWGRSSAYSYQANDLGLPIKTIEMSGSRKDASSKTAKRHYRKLATESQIVKEVGSSCSSAADCCAAATEPPPKKRRC